MEQSQVITAGAEPVAGRAALYREPLLAAVKLLAGIVPGRNHIPLLACIRIECDGGQLTLGATDSGAYASVKLELEDGVPFVAHVIARDLAKVLAKTPKGSRIELRELDGVMFVHAGRAEFRVRIVRDDGFPVYPLGDDWQAIDIADWDISPGTALDCGIEGLRYPGAVAKLLAKAAKPLGIDRVTVETWTRDDNYRAIIAAGPLEIRTMLLQPEPDWMRSRKRSPFEYRMMDDGWRKAVEYLTDLAARHGLNPDAFEYGRLCIVDGRIMGNTFGGVIYHDTQWVEVLDFETFTSRHVEIKPEVESEYELGAFSVIMPRERQCDACMVTYQTMNDDGTWSDEIPVRTTSGGKLDWDALPALADLFAAGDARGDLIPAERVEENPVSPDADVEIASEASPGEADGVDLSQTAVDDANSDAQNIPEIIPGNISSDALAAILAELRALRAEVAALRSMSTFAASSEGEKINMPAADAIAADLADGWRVDCERLRAKRKRTAERMRQLRARQDLDRRALLAGNLVVARLEGAEARARVLQREIDALQRRADSAERDVAQFRLDRLASLRPPEAVDGYRPHGALLLAA